MTKSFKFMSFSAAAVLGAAIALPLSVGLPVAAQAAPVASSPLWFGPTAGNAAQQLLTLLATAQSDGLNPKRHDARRLAKLVGPAAADPAARRQAETALNNAWSPMSATFATTPMSASSMSIPNFSRPRLPPAAILADAAAAPNLAELHRADGLDDAKLCQAPAGAGEPPLSQRRRAEAARDQPRARPRAPRQPRAATSSSTPPPSAFICTKATRWWIRCAWSPGKPELGRDSHDERAGCATSRSIPIGTSPPETASHNPCAQDPQGRTHPISPLAAMRSSPTGARMPARSTRCRSTGARSPTAAPTDQRCARSPGPPIRWAR